MLLLRSVKDEIIRNDAGGDIIFHGKVSNDRIGVFYSSALDGTEVRCIDITIDLPQDATQIYCHVGTVRFIANMRESGKS